MFAHSRQIPALQSEQFALIGYPQRQVTGFFLAFFAMASATQAPRAETVDAWVERRNRSGAAPLCACGYGGRVSRVRRRNGGLQSTPGVVGIKRRAQHRATSCAWAPEQSAKIVSNQCIGQGHYSSRSRGLIFERYWNDCGGVTDPETSLSFRGFA